MALFDIDLDNVTYISKQDAESDKPALTLVEYAQEDKPWFCGTDEIYEKYQDFVREGQEITKLCNNVPCNEAIFEIDYREIEIPDWLVKVLSGPGKHRANQNVLLIDAAVNLALLRDVKVSCSNKKYNQPQMIQYIDTCPRLKWFRNRHLQQDHSGRK